MAALFLHIHSSANQHVLYNDVFFALSTTGGTPSSCNSSLLIAAEGALSCVQITLVDTDDSHELIWAGTESGGVYALQCPTLKRYSSSR